LTKSPLTRWYGTTWWICFNIWASHASFVIGFRLS
jgi:hypothetical protein